MDTLSADQCPHKNFDSLETFKRECVCRHTKDNEGQYTMSVTETVTQGTSSKRKRDQDLAELEVDLNAGEPPSKKALRKAKRSKTGTQVAVEEEDTGDAISTPGTKDSKKAAPNAGRSPWGIWIGNLSFKTSKDELMTFLTTDAGHSIPR